MHFVICCHTLYLQFSIPTVAEFVISMHYLVLSFWIPVIDVSFSVCWFSYSISHILCFLSGQKLLRLFSSKVYCLCLTACFCCDFHFIFFFVGGGGTGLIPQAPSCFSDLQQKICISQSPLYLTCIFIMHLLIWWTVFRKMALKVFSAVHSAEAASQPDSSSFFFCFFFYNLNKHPTDPLPNGTLSPGPAWTASGSLCPVSLLS